MTFLVGLASNWRLIALGLGVIALGWLGWYVKGKFDRAAEADRIEAVLNETTVAYKELLITTFKAESEKLRLSTKLAEAQKQREVVTKEVIRYVRTKGSSAPDCAIPVDVLRQLNRARGYHALPEPAE